MKRKIFVSVLAAALILSMSIPVFAADEPAFSDISTLAADVQTAINYSAEMGFVKGVGGGLFDPNGNITRGQFALVWARVFHTSKHEFTDATRTANEMDNAVVLMSGFNFFNGVSTTLFDVNGNITREQASAVFSRAYFPDAADGDEYKTFTDSDSISDYARDSVSGCVVFGLYDGIASPGGEFKPQADLKRSELCQMIFNIMHMKYKVNVDTSITGGTVVPSATSVRKGDTVTLTITPEEGKELVASSLKYIVYVANYETLEFLSEATLIEGNSFVMPNHSVLITAEFADIEEAPAVPES